MLRFSKYTTLQTVVYISTLCNTETNLQLTINVNQQIKKILETIKIIIFKMENKNVKQRIKRDKPNKKWTEDEVIKIINYLR